MQGVAPAGSRLVYAGAPCKRTTGRRRRRHCAPGGRDLRHFRVSHDILCMLVVAMSQTACALPATLKPCWGFLYVVHGIEPCSVTPEQKAAEQALLTPFAAICQVRNAALPGLLTSN